MKKDIKRVENDTCFYWNINKKRKGSSLPKEFWKIAITTLKGGQLHLASRVEYINDDGNTLTLGINKIDQPLISAFGSSLAQSINRNVIFQYHK
jgi:hypothetical protein